MHGRGRIFDGRVRGQGSLAGFRPGAIYSADPIVRSATFLPMGLYSTSVRTKYAVPIPTRQVGWGVRTDTSIKVRVGDSPLMKSASPNHATGDVSGSWRRDSTAWPGLARFRHLILMDLDAEFADIVMQEHPPVPCTRLRTPVVACPVFCGGDLKCVLDDGWNRLSTVKQRLRMPGDTVGAYAPKEGRREVVQVETCWSYQVQTYLQIHFTRFDIRLLTKVT